MSTTQTGTAQMGRTEPRRDADTERRGIIAAYAVSRGLAKAGSREDPFIIGSDRDNGR